jgi:hypothetical protein
MLCFNPSQVQFTPGGVKLPRYLHQMFQSLTGSIHTGKDYQVFITLRGVSIPHRFNSHLNVMESLGKKKNSGGWCFNPSQFQSLTGSIHTFIIRMAYLYKVIEFQSLTGSIHTSVASFSIPHRLLNCFNPSQVQFTQLLGLMYFSFNPSQVQFTLRYREE